MIHAPDANALADLVAELDAPRTPKEKRKGPGKKTKVGLGETSENAHGVHPSIKANLDGFSDEELLQWARKAKNGRKFIALYDAGDVDGYPSESEADFALLVLLAYWTGNDGARMERLFDGSALGERGKWTDRPDYRGTSIANAIAFNGGKAPDLTETIIERKEGGGMTLRAQRKPPPEQPRYGGDGASANGDGHHKNGRGATAAPGDDRPTILVESLNQGDSLGKWTGEALEAIRQMNTPPRIFQRGGVIARLKEDDMDKSMGIEPLNQDALRGVLDRVAYWGEPRVSKKGKPFIKWGPPRMEIIRDLAALPGWDPSIIPPIEGVVESPRFTPDGKLITKRGYHPETRTYYNPAPEIEGIEIPFIPRMQQVDDAKALIFDDLLVDFPFSDDASRANALAVMLLPFARLMIDGPTPIHMFEASTEGTGKGKLANACAFPALGGPLRSTTQKEDEAEWRKAITTSLMAGYSHFFIDNMSNPRGWDDVLLPVESGTFASATTERIWIDRQLGSNKEVKIPIKCVWMGSGNNVEWSRELSRRVVSIRLNALIENPCERSGFKHDPLEDWMRENRRELLKACLILVQNWIAEDRPMGKQRMGSYEHYARVMGGILDAAMVKGFLANLPKGRGLDRDSSRWPALIAVWNDARGSMSTSVGQIYDLMFGNLGERDNEPVPANVELQVVFADILGDKSALSQKQKLGHALAKQEGRVWGEFRIVRCSAKTPNGSPLYKLGDPNEPF